MTARVGEKGERASDSAGMGGGEEVREENDTVALITAVFVQQPSTNVQASTNCTKAWPRTVIRATKAGLKIDWPVY